MTTPPSRAIVRALLESHARQQAAACLEGREHAALLDINDELNDAANHIRARFGDLAAEQFMRLYAEEQLAFALDAQKNPATVWRRIRPEGAPVVMQSQLPPPKRGLGGFAAAIVALLAFGLLIGIAHH